MPLMFHYLPIHGSVGYKIISGDRSVVISGDTDVMDVMIL